MFVSMWDCRAPKQERSGLGRERCPWWSIKQDQTHDVGEHYPGRSDCISRYEGGREKAIGILEEVLAGLSEER